jgi:hypothetical protein
LLPLATHGEPAQAQIPAPEVDGGYLKLGFDRLSGFKFVAPEYDPACQPEGCAAHGRGPDPGRREGLERQEGHRDRVHAADEARQRQGRRIPAHGEPDGLLLRHRAEHERLGDREDSQRAFPITQDVPISFRGTFKVSAAFESGYMTGIYELDAEGPGQVAE